MSHAIATNPMRPCFTRVIKTVQETADVFTLELEPPVGGDFQFAPGQFNMLYVPGIGEAAVSLSGDPAHAYSLVHTVRAVGAVSAGITRLHEGAQIGVRGPFGAGWPLDGANGQDIVIVAGGLGLAPLRPAIYHVLRHRERYGRIVIAYGARTPDDALFLGELQAWRTVPDVEVLISVDRANGHQGRPWPESVGHVTGLLSRAIFDPSFTTALVCGPEIMMRTACAELERLGMRDSAMFVSLERNMKCGIGFCGHCQLGPAFVCKDGPVFGWNRARSLLAVREL